MPGEARDIDVGADGSVYAVGKDGTVYKWTESSYSWSNVGGTGERIAVTASGTPWIVTDNGAIYRRRGSNWQKLPGEAEDIAAAAAGDVWIVGKGGGAVYKWSEDNYTWNRFDGEGARIAAGGSDVWLITKDNTIFRRQGNNWQNMPGEAGDIAVGPDGAVWATARGNGAIYQWNDSAYSWQQVQGEGGSIAAGPNGAVWTISGDRKIYRRGGSGGGNSGGSGMGGMGGGK